MSMNSRIKYFLTATVFLSTLAGCSGIPARDSVAQRIVGAWFVRMPEAPFQYHMLIFNADGTVVQSNPDAGDPHTSDSNGMGAWVSEGNRIVGKFVEVTADRTTRAFVSRGEIAFRIAVLGDSISGAGSARFYDVNGAINGGPVAFTLSGCACSGEVRALLAIRSSGPAFGTLFNSGVIPHPSNAAPPGRSRIHSSTLGSGLAPCAHGARPDPEFLEHTATSSTNEVRANHEDLSVGDERDSVLTPSHNRTRFAGKNGRVALDQLRTVDRDRLRKRLGMLTPATLAAVFGTLAEMFEFS